MTSVKVFVPYGAVGLNCTEEAFEAGLAMKPDIISSDAGSTDSGPYYLGSGHGKYSIADVKRDLKRMVLGADKLGIPMTIGSAGTCGSDEGVNSAKRPASTKRLPAFTPSKTRKSSRKNIVKAKFLPSTVHRKSPKKPLMSAAPS